MLAWTKIIILALVVVCSLCMDVRYLNEQYFRRKTNCTNRCLSKGYFQDLCIKLCMSPSCYHQIYQQNNMRL